MSSKAGAVEQSGTQPDALGHFGPYGGSYVSETLVHALDDLKAAYFRWRDDAEFVARMDWKARIVAPDAPRPDQLLVDTHYFRKHGKNAYYGQK